MDEYQSLLNKFKLVNDKLNSLIQKFPQGIREEIIFDKWSLKDVVAHLNHWMIHDIDCLGNLINGKEPFWEPDIEDYNKRGIKERKNKNWDEIYYEFTSLRVKLVNTYINLPQSLINKKFWSDKDETPSKFLKEDINHWQDEHIVQLENYFNFNK